MAAGGGAGGPAQEDEDAEADAFWRDFTEGMGAGGLGELSSEAQERYRPEDIPDDLRMGSWRLAYLACRPIQTLVAQVEDGWRNILPDLSLYPLEMEWKYLDSLDPDHKVPLSYMKLEPPERGQPGYPRLELENRAYCSRAFRKLHIEVAARQDGLQVFHCVMYPRLQFDLPILSMDLVASAETGAVSLAIADPCPVTPDLSLPSFYAEPIRELQARYGVENNRQVPDWGRSIFSPLCIIMRPQTNEELGRFLKYTIALSLYHTRVGQIVNPVAPAGRAQRIAAIHAGHARYAEQMLLNDKTRRVLEKSFSPGLADAYLRHVMFDVEDLPPAG